MYTSYISKLRLLSEAEEDAFLLFELKRTCYNGTYPYRIFPEKELEEVQLAPITVFYGGNGSGKTTLLNVIAEKAKLTRHSAFNGSAFFSRYVAGCKLYGKQVPDNSQILTSDDVFDYVLNMRHLNDGLDVRREELFSEYTKRKYASNRFTGLAQYDEWRESYEAKRKSQSQYVRERVMRNVDMFSNGESAMKYFVDRITENALYLLDEPENSLSPARQQELCRFIEDSARFYNCQFIIATHSPFLLAMRGARIYDLDTVPVTTCRWTELPAVRAYHDFFRQHEDEFD